MHPGPHAVVPLASSHAAPPACLPAGPQRVAVAGQAHHRSGTCGPEEAHVRTGAGGHGANMIGRSASVPTFASHFTSFSGHTAQPH